MISREILKRLRNDVPIEKLIVDVLKLPSKHCEGYFRFLCPICTEFNTAVKLQTNLGRCFRCNKNFNPIDMVMTVEEVNFVDAVEFLTPLLLKFKNIQR